ncbi:hypothetical protein GZH47_33165 (plasmid) [Paenibacillus rhizovicinus]|uniref:Protein RecA n=1 Tax=Paenibacillus rhizovicinus TaxID=2704463 RepID=A0A6C0PBK6_9BACL|nr:hypothetical protein [Paenibacillus rhizovicinus]QHW35745.1 hypothetical protein GZH47_33165 [Paenibacillus rhizovicinus]
MAPKAKSKSLPESPVAAAAAETGKGGYDVQADFNKRFGAGTFFTFEDIGASREIFPIPSGIPSFDYASGIGGLPLGRIVEVYGPESSGKTTFSLYVAAAFQRIAKVFGHRLFGRRVGFVDAEHALDPIHVAAIGVDTSASTGMLINQPNNGEEAFDLIEAMIKSDQFGVIIVDSVPSLVPKAEIEGEMDDQFIGLQARLMGKGLRKIHGIAQKHDVLVIFINQIREKPGTRSPHGGTPETTPGGRALKFYASMRLDVRRTTIEKGNTFIGQSTTVKIVKNKCARPFTKAEYDYYWQGGIDMTKNIMTVAIDTNVIGRAGAYYYVGPSNKEPYTDGNGNELKWQGAESLLESLRVSPQLFAYINDMVLGIIPRDAQFIVEEADDPSELVELERETGEESDNASAGPDLFTQAGQS